MAIHILVCDDDEAFARRLAALIEALAQSDGLPVGVSAVSDPAVLNDSFLRQFDLMLLDIDMGAHSGMELARRIRALRLDTLLIFVTNYVEYGLEGYEVDAFRYILKRDLEAKLPVYFREAVAAVQRREDAFLYSISGEQYRVKHSDILYLESRQRTVCLHTREPLRNGDCFYAKLDDLETELGQAGFLRIHKSYLVNMACIRKLNYDKAILQNDEILPVSQKKYSERKSRFLQWRAEQ